MKKKDRKKSACKLALPVVRTSIKAGSWWDNFRKSVKGFNDKLKWN